ncbi:MAG: hypothetical protein GDA68_17905 [Nitrospira sp. CR2.1]|nr:hypothetical protein [Nitrospira sp. CR2.1]
MKWQELILRGRQLLLFPDLKQARLHWSYSCADVRVLHVSCENGNVLELPDAVDAGEMLDDPRVFVLEGRRIDHVCLIGGAQTYSISSIGGIEKSERLFRENRFTEYWNTLLFDRQDDLLIVYESGVLILDDLFRVRFHQKKMINDVLSNVGKNRLTFVRDHETEWSMDLPDVRSEGEQHEVP